MRADVGHGRQPDRNRIGVQNHRCNGCGCVRMRLLKWRAEDNNRDAVSSRLTAFDVGAIVRHVRLVRRRLMLVSRRSVPMFRVVVIAVGVNVQDGRVAPTREERQSQTYRRQTPQHEGSLWTSRTVVKPRAENWRFAALSDGAPSPVLRPDNPRTNCGAELAAGYLRAADRIARPA